MLAFFVFIRLSVMIKIMYRNKSDHEYYKRGNFYGRTLLLGPTLYWAAPENENGGHQMRLHRRHSYDLYHASFIEDGLNPFSECLPW